jgi:cell division protein FtsI (penicillin-binding protein 3)
MVPHPWREINTMTIGFGHGIAVSATQVAAATAAVVNGGVMHPPTVVRRAPGLAVPGTRVVSERTSEHMRRLMRLVVTEGTARQASVAGYVVGGKTGTAEKAGGGGYKRKALLSSFVAAFPMTAPRYVAMVLLDEPQATARTHGYATGGWTAAPTIGRIVSRIGPMLGLMPVDEEADGVRQALVIDSMQKERRVASF